MVAADARRRSSRLFMSLTAVVAANRVRAGFELSLDICVFLFLPVMVVEARGVAPLVAVAGICALALVADNFAAAWWRIHRLVPFFAALVLWGLVSSFWAIEPQRSLLIAARLTGMFAAALALVAAASELRAPQRLICCLFAGLVLALVMAVVQFQTGGGLTAALSRRPFIEPALNHVEDGFGMLIPPIFIALLLRRRLLTAVALAVPTVAVVFLLVGDTARVAFSLGVAFAVPLYFWRKWLTRAAAAGSVIFILTAPLVLPPLLDHAAVVHDAKQVKFSLFHRLEIWWFVGGKIAEKPVLGWGLDSSRSIPGGKEPTPLGGDWLPLHPHDAALQVWLELGAPGAILFACFVAWVWLQLGAAAWPPLYAAAAGSSLVIALLVSFGSYGAWQEWWISTEFLTFFLILVLGRLAKHQDATLAQ